MESKFEVKHYDKLFGNCEIVWKIEDFILAISDESSSLQSPEFCVSGPKPTKWKFIFIPKVPETALMRLFLERQNDSGPRRVFVDWSLTVGSFIEDFYYSEHKHDFEVLTKIGIDVSDLFKVLSTFQPFDCDTLLIRCHLIVKYRDRTTNLTDPESFGLRCLAKDLGFMFQSGKGKDLVLQVGENDISVHKAVVSRNTVLQKLVQKSKNVSSVEFPSLNPEAVKKYVHYLYTGDLDKILQNPSIAMYKCLKVMDTELLKRYFSLEELTLYTKVTVDEFEYLWVIPSFGFREEKILSSPPFKKADLDTTWQLTIYFNGIDDNDCLSIFADVVDGNKPKNVCLEFAVEDSEGETYYPRRILSYNGNYGTGITNFIDNAYLSNTSLIAEDTLNLAFKVRTWDSGEHCSSTGSHMISFTTATRRSSYYELSKGLLNVYRSGMLTDIQIATVGAVFQAHRCILSARSPVLSSMIEKMGDETILSLKDMTPTILNLLLGYIYSGRLLNLDNETLDMLCKAAETYEISSLVQECKQALRNKLLD